MSPTALVDPAGIDLSNVLYDLDAIRRTNPQRFEMEQLTAVVRLELETRLIVGYKDVGRDEFWIPGHFPGEPIMPRMLICEASAQLCSFCCHKIEPLPDGFFAFGGIQEVQFQGVVRPGDRLVIVARAERRRRQQRMFMTQAFVGSELVYHGMIIGVHVPRGAGGPQPTP